MPKPESVTLRQLRALTAVAEHGSITAAARTTGLTPPAVHSQIKTLATSLGVAVLERGQHGNMVLTAEGRVLTDAADRVSAVLRNALRDVEALADGLTGSVRLGVVSTGKYFAPSLVARLKHALPEVRVRLIVGNRQEIIKALETQDIHLAIMGRPPRRPMVEAEVIGPHPHVIVAAPDHPLTAISDIPPERLLDETFIVREEGSGTRILMTRFLDRIGDGRPYEAVEMDSNETIKQAVIAGLGIALISAHTVAEELRHGRLVTFPVAGLPIIRQWYLLHLAGERLGPAAARIRETISAMRGDYLPQIPGLPVRPGNPAAPMARQQRSAGRQYREAW